MRGTQLPPTDAKAGGLWAALDAQTDRLDRANGRTSDVIAIADNCQAQQLKTQQQLQPRRPWWKLWGG